jgi:hypothetical protein
MATAANVVKFKRSAVTGKIPATADLALGEIALNTYDGVAYLKKSVASVETVVKLQPFPTGGTNGQILSIDSGGNLIWSTSNYVTSTSLASTLSSYVTNTSLSSYITNTSLSSTLSSYVTSTSLASSLSSYVTNTSLSSAISSYNYITLTSLSMDIPAAASGSGNVAYDNATGKFKYTPPNLSSFITTSVATLSSLTSIGSIGVDTTAKGNLIVNGNLRVDGNTATPGDILVNNISVAESLTKAVFLYQDGELTIYTGTVRWYASQPVTVTKIIARLAQASDIGVTLKVRKNGTVVNTINIAGNSLKTTISTGLFNMAVDDYLTVDTTAIGNANNTGSGLSVQFSYYYS